MKANCTPFFLRTVFHPIPMLCAPVSTFNEYEYPPSPSCSDGLICKKNLINFLSFLSSSPLDFHIWSYFRGNLFIIMWCLLEYQIKFVVLNKQSSLKWKFRQVTSVDMISLNRIWFNCLVGPIRRNKFFCLSTFLFRSLWSVEPFFVLQLLFCISKEDDTLEDA